MHKEGSKNMKSAYLNMDNELREVLELILTELQKQGVLKNVANRDKLVEDTLENLKGALGDNISREALKEPAMKLKLATSLVATFTHGVGNDKFNFAALFQPISELQLQKTLGNMLNQYFKLQPQEAKAFVELTNKFEELRPTPETPRPKPGGKSNKTPEEEKTIFAAIYSDDGTLLDVLEGVGVSAKNASQAIITVSEMLTSDLAPNFREKLEENDFLHGVGESLHSHINNTPKLTPRD